MRWRIFTLLLALIMTLTLMPAFAFDNVRDYGSAGFLDVDGGWSQPYIQQCYELGLMDGTGIGRFEPKGTLSVAQAVTVAVRLSDLYNGGDGVIGQSGAHWYDEAVIQAEAQGILTQGQFDRYDCPATRAEVAGLLAAALPQSEYQAINAISSLPDVNGATPYSDAIFTLYNAGILTGGDAYGTFSPDEPLTREALAAILCRLCKPETRVTLQLAVKPKDLTVRSSNMLLMLGGVPLYGVVEIGGEYYVPLALFEGNELPLSGAIKYDDGQWNGNQPRINVSDSTWKWLTTAPDYKIATPQGNVMGTASAGPTVVVAGTSTTLMTLDGHFPMVRVSDLAAGMSVQGNVIQAPMQGVAAPSLTYENDLVGQALAGLLRSTPRETVRAIHDYIVNTLTYDPYTEESEAAYVQAGTQYQLGPNFTLAAGYGVCQDYAELFQIMCLRAGIPCELVTGQAGGGGHAWNRVYLDGTWYYIDCTWDDPVGREPVLRHSYFLVGADTMVNSHYWEGEDYPMPDEYDPAWANLDPNNITSADMFRKCLVAQMMQRQTTIRLRTTASGAYGGIGCVYAYPLAWASISGGYDRSSGCYVYTVEYW